MTKITSTLRWNRCGAKLHTRAFHHSTINPISHIQVLTHKRSETKLGPSQSLVVYSGYPGVHTEQVRLNRYASCLTCPKVPAQSLETPSKTLRRPLGTRRHPGDFLESPGGPRGSARGDERWSQTEIIKRLAPGRHAWSTGLARNKSPHKQNRRRKDLQVNQHVAPALQCSTIRD